MTGSGLHSDVLIVGAGSAGSVLADQLSLDAERTVTVLESGAALTDPEMAARAANGLQLPIGMASPLVSRYLAELTEATVREMMIVRGATVGGSGAVNGGYFCRALPRDFDGPDLPGWSWPEVLEHFRAIETDLDFTGPVHGDSGPIPVQRARETRGATEMFTDRAREAGFSWIADLNGADRGSAPPVGVGAVPRNIVNGVRVGPGAAYLLPALGRPNLTLLTRTRAVRVNISAGRAVAVQAVGPAGAITLPADRIVLSAGAIESAHLLMLSGVGDEAMLRGVGVEVVAGLPVGANCADHPEWVLPVDWAAATERPVLEVVLHTVDDIEVRPYTRGFAAMAGEVNDRGPGGPHIGVALMQPRARGRLSLVSADPLVAPRIEHRYDSEPDDIVALRRGTELVREILGGTTEVGSPSWSTSQHLCGSTPMGTEHDERAVVDPRCRVRGVDALWVVDGSVLPRIPSRGPHATIVMLAHRAVEFLRSG